MSVVGKTDRRFHDAGWGVPALHRAGTQYYIGNSERGGLLPTIVAVQGHPLVAQAVLGAPVGGPHQVQVLVHRGRLHRQPLRGQGLGQPRPVSKSATSSPFRARRTAWRQLYLGGESNSHHCPTVNSHCSGWKVWLWGLSLVMCLTAVACDAYVQSSEAEADSDSLTTVSAGTAHTCAVR